MRIVSEQCLLSCLILLFALSAFGEEWYIGKAGIPDGLSPSELANPVTIAIVDDGIRLTHKEITPFLWNNPGEVPDNGVDDDGNGLKDDFHGWDFGDSDHDVRPAPERIGEFYHGTHVAGIIAQIARYVYGEAAPDHIRFMVIKTISDASTKPYLKTAFQGIEYAMQMKADIILCAWGLNVISDEEMAILDKAMKEDTLIVSASGNFNEERDQYPAAHPAAFAIAGHDVLGRKLPLANYGGYVDLIAPGEDILAASSSDDDSRESHSGTSQASAIAAASLAVLKLQNPDYSNHQLRAALLNNATYTAQNTSFPAQLGAGKLNLRNALKNGYDTGRKVHFATKGVLSLKTGQKADQAIGPIENVAGIRLQFADLIPDGVSGSIQVHPSDESSLKVQAYTMSDLPAEIYVPGGYLGIRYFPDPDSTDSSFLIDYAAEPIDYRSLYCSGTRQLGTEGLIEDGSGELPYAAYSDCKWLISAPEGKVIRFTFLEFDTETQVDKLYFFHGSRTSDSIMAIYTGPDLPPDLTTWGNEVLVWFVTDGQNQQQGWKAQFDFVEATPD